MNDAKLLTTSVMGVGGLVLILGWLSLIAYTLLQDDPPLATKGYVRFIYIGGEKETDLYLDYEANETRHLVRATQIVAMTEYNPKNAKVLGTVSLIYFAGGKLGTPYTIDEFIKARLKVE